MIRSGIKRTLSKIMKEELIDRNKILIHLISLRPLWVPDLEVNMETEELLDNEITIIKAILRIED